MSAGLSRLVAVGVLALLPTMVMAAVPLPSEWIAPAGLPKAPGTPYELNLKSALENPHPQAPEIAAWNETVHPDESFTMTGVRFTTRSDFVPRVWLMALTEEGNKTFPCKVWHSEEHLLTATIPSDIPYGMYLVWVQNEYGLSAPVTLNRATAEWVGPLGNRARPGETKRVFGRNLATDHSEDRSYVYLQSVADGSGAMGEVTSVEPYQVAFTIPEGLSDGEYRVYVHNGHGGDYGWSAPVSLTVDAVGYQRGSTRIELSPSGEDDTAAFKEAFSQLRAAERGGSLILAPGTYMLSERVTVPPHVRIAGSEQGDTNIQGGSLLPGGAHVTLEHLNLLGSSVATVNDSQNPNMQLRHLRILNQAGTSGATLQIREGVGLELAHCEIGNLHLMGAADAWIHNNRISGASYGAEGGISFSGGGILNRRELRNEHIIIEQNHFETRDWPVGPNGNRNYRDFLSEADFRHIPWVKRLINTSLHRGSISRMYFAHNTSKDVATQDNKGEMILLHEARGSWFGQVLQVEGTTLILQTERKIEGGPDRIVRNADTVINAGGNVPTRMGASGSGYLDHQAYVTVVRGPGLGQVRRIVSHANDRVEVETPFRVQPTEASVVVLQYLYKDNIIYQNDLNGFPEGYEMQQHSASTGIQLGGGGFRNVAEGNVSRRTNGSRQICGRPISPSFWNEFRNETALDAFGTGFQFTFWMSSPDFVANLGNAYRGGHVEIQGNRHLLFTEAWYSGENNDPKRPDPDVDYPFVQNGNIIEHAFALSHTHPGKTLAGSAHGIREMPLSRTLYRKNTIELNQPWLPAESVSLGDFEISFEFRLNDPVAGAGDLFTLGLNGLTSIAFSVEADEAAPGVLRLPGNQRKVLGPDWQLVTVRRQGSELSLLVGEVEASLTVPANQASGVRIRVGQPFYLRNFVVHDGEGAVVFEDTFQNYPRGRFGGGIFHGRGWSGHLWGDMRIQNEEPFDRAFLVRGHDFSFASTGGTGMRAFHAAEGSDPILVGNDITPEDPEFEARQRE